MVYGTGWMRSTNRFGVRCGMLRIMPPAVYVVGCAVPLSVAMTNIVGKYL